MPNFKSLGLLLLVGSAAVQADPLQDVGSIRVIAQDFVRAQLTTRGVDAKLFIEAAPLDARLRLPHCPAPAGFLPTGAAVAARTTIGVRCTEPQWSVYVPVSVESEFSVLVLRQALARGTSLGAADVEVQRRRVAGFAANYVLDVTALAGKHLKNDTAPGTPLTVDLLVPDIIIKRGQRVTLLASAGGIDVRAQGEAIADANVSGRVRVENLGSHKIVEGQVESADLVRVGP